VSFKRLRLNAFVLFVFSVVFVFFCFTFSFFFVFAFYFVELFIIVIGGLTLTHVLQLQLQLQNAKLVLSTKLASQEKNEYVPMEGTFAYKFDFFHFVGKAHMNNNAFHLSFTVLLSPLTG